MRGRHPSGPSFVDKLPGHTTAKERLRVVLETIAGDCRVSEACERLGISEQRFDELRLEALQGAIAALEPKPLGRRPQASSTDDAEVRQLKDRVAELEAQLQIAAVRTEVAAILPHNANRFSLARLCRRLGYPFERVYLDNIPVTGHCFCADPFINLHSATAQGRLEPGQIYVMTAVGLGATFSATVLQH
jgi:transposase-like protein